MFEDIHVIQDSKHEEITKITGNFFYFKDINIKRYLLITLFEKCPPPKKKR